MATRYSSLDRRRSSASTNRFDLHCVVGGCGKPRFTRSAYCVHHAQEIAQGSVISPNTEPPNQSRAQPHPYTQPQFHSQSHSSQYYAHPSPTRDSSQMSTMKPGYPNSKSYSTLYTHIPEEGWGGEDGGRRHRHAVGMPHEHNQLRSDLPHTSSVPVMSQSVTWVSTFCVSFDQLLALTDSNYINSFIAITIELFIFYFILFLVATCQHTSSLQLESS